MTTQICDRCGEPKPLTYRVRSDILDMRVCWDCGITAKTVKRQAADSHIEVTLLKLKKAD